MSDYPGLVSLLLANREELERPQGEMDWKYEKWHAALAGDQAASRALDELKHRKCDRASILQASNHVQLADEQTITKVFVWSQVWGHALVGYGPYRVAKVLDQPKAKKCLAGTFKLLRTEGAMAAFDAMKPRGQYNLSGLGQAFATKFFFFAGYTHAPQPPQPLVLDRLVGLALNNGEPELFNVHCGEEWNRRDYANYLTAVDAISNHGPLADYDPSTIECALFRIGAKIAGPDGGPNDNRV